MEFREIKRLQNLCRLEDQLYTEGCEIVAGVDEVGRGSLAGPLVAAAVILDRKKILIENINDSKKLTEKMRDLIFERILDCCICWATALVSPQEIDRLSITKANILAFKRAACNLKVKPDIVITDFITSTDGLDPVFIPIENGDSNSVSVAAASIVAKVTRDRMMKEASSTYPEYGFDDNKGYGTGRHLSSLKRNGPCEIHRMSFRRVTF
ncbi:MAG: ribonuclease HII [Actinobacteria bacterium]|nr:ribonuclease HII [Actinomycetota bacterium]